VLADYRQHAANTYGWRGLLSTLLSRIAEETEDARRAIRRRLTAAEVRAAILQQAAKETEGPLRSRLQQGIEKYDEFAQRYRLRAELYEGRGVRERGRAFRRLLAAHAYGRDPWQIGPLGLGRGGFLGLSGISLF